ncbi:cell wall biogenesis protein [Bulinus truncatus]|nr:cell wall biogenesis protein [Bulinus truncatus]
MIIINPLLCVQNFRDLPVTRTSDAHVVPNQWIQFFTSTENRHALPLFTSLLNCLCAYDPVGYGVPYNHLMFTDSREPLVEVALQVLCVTIENDSNAHPVSVDGTSGGTAMDQTGDSGGTDNLFLNYLSRIHREEVFHKIITTGHQRLQPLFDCLLTIIVNVSPYLKTLSMVASTKLLHLLEAFSTPWFLYASATNHHLVFFLLEVFNNIIQYQFDGNANLVYTIIRKRNVFHQLANLPIDHSAIAKAMTKRGKKFAAPPQDTRDPQTMEGAQPALEAEPGTLKVTLAATPRIDKMTERSAPDENHHHQDSATSNIQPQSEICSEEGSQDERHASESTEDPSGDDTSSLKLEKSKSLSSPPKTSTQKGSKVSSPTEMKNFHIPKSASTGSSTWVASPEWVQSWKQKLPLQTIMRMLQVLVPQVEKICIDKGLTDETEILKFLQHGTLVGLLPVPHPILIRKYQANSGTTMWFRTYLWGVIYLRNVDPPIWYDTNVKLFEIQRV